MKVRLGFVSNSSSSSFLLNKNKLTKLQYHKIFNVEETISNLSEKQRTKLLGLVGDVEYLRDWSIREEDGEISGYTYLNNFDMIEFINFIGANKALLNTDGGIVCDESEESESFTWEDWVRATDDILEEIGIDTEERDNND